MNTLNYNLPDALDAAVSAELKTWKAENKIARIWQKDASVWTNDDEARWLGWLDIIDEELQNVDAYRAFHADITAAGFTQLLLMGMGGSSLCPEVLAMTFGKDHFHILDSTDPVQVKAVEGELDLEKTLFIVASKSGSTLEPNCFKQYFFELLAARVGRENAGKQFVAITDPGSKMEQVAKDDGFRKIFYGKPDVGGRFSALSAFGMTAAASMGLDVESFLQSASEMSDACRESDHDKNPGALLGTILGVCHSGGRDKLTIFTSPELHDVGAWLEQLIAESTGKEGVAIIPVDREPRVSASEYRDDRVFVFLSAGTHAFGDPAADLNAAGHPTVNITMESIDSLGQEFFRWEFATAVAGSIMKINPFNQPDVEAAKIEAKKLTEEYESTGEMPDETPFFEDEGIGFYSNKPIHGADAGSILKSFIDLVGTGDYFAILAYIPMTAEHERLLTSIREKVLAKKKVATCLGFGPRFLHSTGQAYKGGANNGVFLQITCDDAVDLDVPGQKYTFSIVKTAQARGDLQVLQDRGRRTLRVHLGKDVEDGLHQLARLI